MGAYRRDQYENPASFVSQATQCFEQFPDCVIESVTSPRSGLQTECAWPPNLTEIRVRCERSLKQFSVIALNNARKARAAELARNPPPPPVGRREMIEEACRRNDNIDYWLNPARASDHPADPLASNPRKKWEPRSLKDLAAAAGKVMTDEEIEADYAANSKLCPPPKDDWKKLKWS